MAQATILVVEDEGIVAMDLQQRLSGMGYSVSAVAASREEALRKAAEMRPDLVLMDIRLKGYVDGVEVAGTIREMLDVPHVFLTAYSDPATLARAKVTEPFGYIVKPFDDETLRRTIEMALYRRDKERQLKQGDACLKATFLCVSEGLIAADENSRVVLMNRAAEVLTGWSSAEGLTRDLSEVLSVVTETETESKNPATAVYEKGIEISVTGLLQPADGGRQIPITANAAPILDRLGSVTGVVVAFRAAPK
ncbi:MAG TPA: response regulator [Terriglobia bacterium]|nr:response regulator [Terriglobia bacterium]